VTGPLGSGVSFRAGAKREAGAARGQRIAGGAVEALGETEVAFAALTGTDRLLAASPTAAKWLGVAIFITAGGYQLTPWKDFCLRRCRSPIGALMYYAGFKGRGRDARVGLHHGITCVGCC
jgi:predicted metal-binding membrane protein